MVKVDLLTLIDPQDINYSDVWLAVAQKLLTQLACDAIRIDPQISDRLHDGFTEQVLTSEQIKDFSAEIKAGAEAGTGMPYLGKLFASFTSAIRIGSTHRDVTRTVVRNTYGEFIAALNPLFAAAVDGVIEAGQGKQLLIMKRWATCTRSP